MEFSRVLVSEVQELNTDEEDKAHLEQETKSAYYQSVHNLQV